VSPAAKRACPFLGNAYPHLPQKVVRRSGLRLEGEVHHGALRLVASEIVLVDGVVVGVEVDERVVEVLPSQDVFEHADEVAEHAALGGLPRDVDEEDIGEFGRNCAVNTE
jgi:hypothetical protein